MPHPCKGFTNRTITGPILVGTRLPVATDSYHHQARVILGQALIIEAQPFHDTWSKILNQHIAFQCQFSDDFLALFGLEINGDGALIPEQSGRIKRHIARMLAHAAHGVSLGRFNLDHIRPKVGKHAGTGWPRYG